MPEQTQRELIARIIREYIRGGIARSDVDLCAGRILAEVGAGCQDIAGLIAERDELRRQLDKAYEDWGRQVCGMDEVVADLERQLAIAEKPIESEA